VRNVLTPKVPSAPLIRHVLLALVAGLGFYLLTSNLSSFRNFEVGEIALYAIVIAGLSVLTGTNGQISLGHGAFMAIGAYCFAYLQSHEHLPLIVMFLAAVAAAGALGLIVGIPATRLKGPYLAGMTLILAVGIPQLADKYNGVFGGDQGLTTLPPTPPGGVDPQRWLSWIEIAGALIMMVLLANLLRSRFGRAMRAVRDNEIAASLAGIHVPRTKVLAFVISAGYAGLAGAFLGLSTGIVNTGEFSLTLSIYLLAGMVLGGAGTLTGAWWGGILLVFLPQWSTSVAKHFSLGSSASANLAVVFYGIVLIVVMMLAPGGIQGGVRWLARRTRAGHGSDSPSKAPAAAGDGSPQEPDNGALATTNSERTTH